MFPSYWQKTLFSVLPEKRGMEIHLKTISIVLVKLKKNILQWEH